MRVGLGKRDHRKQHGQRYTYSVWDGNQTGFEFNATEIMADFNDDLLYHGDINAALRRMMQEGFESDRDRILGLREILEELCLAREKLLGQYDLNSVYSAVALELAAVLEIERESLDRLATGVRGSDDEGWREIADGVIVERNLQPTFISQDLVGEVRSLQAHDFSSGEALQRFENLLEKLQAEVIQQYVGGSNENAESPSWGHLHGMKDMMAGVNQMLERRMGGEAADFGGFMERFGDFFLESPNTFDELLETMAQRLSNTQAMFNSMLVEEQQELQELCHQILDDMVFCSQSDLITQNLVEGFPNLDWDQQYEFFGQKSLSMGEALSVFEELRNLEYLEQVFKGVSAPGDLTEVDIKRVREVLGDKSYQSLNWMSQVAPLLREAGLIEDRGDHYELTPRAIRTIGQRALVDLFKELENNRAGRHELEHSGIGYEREYSTKPHEFGTSFNLNIERTVRNAIHRTGGGIPVSLLPVDFEVECTENLVCSSTVLMLDLSLSMPIRNNFLPAKKVAMALHSLMSTQFPRDYLGFVGFSETARSIEPQELPKMSWDYVSGTNMQHAFALSRQLLSRWSGSKQIIMITDGEPTAHIDLNGKSQFTYPPASETIDKTLAEVMACTREGIRINTFVLDATPALAGFIEQIARMNDGRVFFTTPETLGSYLLVDFVEHRRKLSASTR